MSLIFWTLDSSVTFPVVKSLTPFLSRPGKPGKCLCRVHRVVRCGVCAQCSSDPSLRIKSFPTWGLKQQAFLISVSLGQKRGCSLAGGLWLRVTTIKVLAGAAVLSRLMSLLAGLGSSLAAGQGHQSFGTWQLTTRQPGFPQSEYAREGVQDGAVLFL